MAPRKNKTQGQRNNAKIKSKGNNPKKELKSVKKTEPVEKPLGGLKWLNDLGGPGRVKKCEVVPEWLEKDPYKQPISTDGSETNTSEYDEYQHLEDKSTSSDASECNCPNSKYPETIKSGILKTQISSTNSLVSKYIQSGMNQVASFIVESAIRFGEEHGVVVPAKDTPNLYEITPPEGKIADKIRKIRFKIPEKDSAYDEGRKFTWRPYAKDSQSGWKGAQTPMPEWKFNEPTNSSSWNSTPDSLEEILPILEKLKQGGGIVDSDLDLEKLRKSEADESDRSDRERVWSKETDRERDRDRDRDRERERDRDRERDREREKEKDRCRERDRDRNRDRSRVGNKERLKEKLRTLRKRYKSLGVPSLKKGRRDSLELGRQRMRAAAGIRKREMASLPSY